MSRYVSFGKKYIEHWLEEQKDIFPRQKILHKKGKTYAIEDLEENSRRYEENFRLLERAIKVYGLNSPQHHKYVKIEQLLNRKDIKIREDLGVLVRDPPAEISDEVEKQIEKEIEEREAEIVEEGGMPEEDDDKFFLR